VPTGRVDLLPQRGDDIGAAAGVHERAVPDVGVLGHEAEHPRPVRQGPDQDRWSARPQAARPQLEAIDAVVGPREGQRPDPQQPPGIGSCTAIDVKSHHCQHKTTRRKKHDRRTMTACSSDFEHVCQRFYGPDAETLANCTAAFASCCRIYRTCRNTPARQCLDDTLLAFPRLQPKGS
jgi:hypothetical protein